MDKWQLPGPCTHQRSKANLQLRRPERMTTAEAALKSAATHRRSTRHVYLVLIACQTSKRKRGGRGNTFLFQNLQAYFHICNRGSEKRMKGTIKDVLNLPALYGVISDAIITVIHQPYLSHFDYSFNKTDSIK